MKYTPELTKQIQDQYSEGISVAEIAASLDIPEKSIIAKLSSLGVYKRKVYLNKKGEAPTKKEEYILRISKLLDINSELLESMEKVTKAALILLEERISSIKSV